MNSRGHNRRSFLLGGLAGAFGGAAMLKAVEVSGPKDGETMEVEVDLLSHTGKLLSPKEVTLKSGATFQAIEVTINGSRMRLKIVMES